MCSYIVVDIIIVFTTHQNDITIEKSLWHYAVQIRSNESTDFLGMQFGISDFSALFIYGVQNTLKNEISKWMDLVLIS